jgi:hypothetical protein
MMKALLRPFDIDLHIQQAVAGGDQKCALHPAPEASVIANASLHTLWVHWQAQHQSCWSQEPAAEAIATGMCQLQGSLLAQCQSAWCAAPPND